jgi:phosphoglucosamine mutase
LGQRKLFGTDGIRGEANVHPMTAEVALRLGRALGYRLRGPAGHRSKVLIGKDTRLSGYLIETALASGLCSAGTDVLLVGPLPTPAIAFLTASMRADAGVVISASHNPYQDNGIKVFAGDGFKLPDDVEAELERLMEADEVASWRPTAMDIGRATRIEDAVGRYAQFAKGAFPKDSTLEGVKIVVDCAHGAAYRVAPEVLRELGAQVVALGVRPNGVNINRRVGALHPEYMARAVKRSGAHLGVALDGDADRCVLADEHGNVVDGDAIMALIARRMISDGALAQKTVVATVMSNIGLERSLAEVGGRVVRVGVGDRYVVEHMRKEGLNFGGEQSGHVIRMDHSTTGDGLVTALTVLGILVREQKPLSELAACMTRFPQVLINVPVTRKMPFEELPGLQRAIREAEGGLGDRGRVLVRYSGTELLARVMVEGPDDTTIKAHADRICDALRGELG